MDNAAHTGIGHTSGKDKIQLTKKLAYGFCKKIIIEFYTHI